MAPLHALRPPTPLPGDVVRVLSAFAERQGWAVVETPDTYDRVSLTVRALWAELDDELLGLGQHRLPRGSFRLFCYALLGAHDLGAGLGRAESFRGAIPALSFRVDHDDANQRSAIVVPWSLPRIDDPDLVVPTIELLVVHRLIVWALRTPVPGALIELPGPRRLSPGTVEALFGDTRVVFGARRAAFTFDAAALRLPLSRDADDIDAFAYGAPCTLLRHPCSDGSLAPRVRHLVTGEAPSGEWLSAQAVARRLAMSEQTLRRRLQAEETSFRSIVEDVRRNAAVVSLARGDESIADLALRLGYSETSAFSRAFHRWTGASPGAFRQEA